MRGCALAGVELTEEAVDLPSFRHPPAAAYVLGPEKGVLSPELIARSDHRVRIPMRFCLNLGVAGAIDMYDRLMTTGRRARRRERQAARRLSQGSRRPFGCHLHRAGEPVTRIDRTRAPESPQAPWRWRSGRSKTLQTPTREMTRRHLIAALPTFLAWLLLAGPAAAQAIERISDDQDWSTFRYKEDGETVCYMASEPKKAEGDYTDRGDVYAIVTHRPASNRIGEVSINAGYAYQKESSVRLKIGSNSWDLFTNGSSAWAPSPEDDQAIVKAMKGGSSMTVKGTSSRGTLTTDTYSLLGFSKAYSAISQACGL